MSVKARSADDSGALEDQADASCKHLPAEQHSSATANIDVYLDDFILVVQVGSRERRQMIWHLFHQIDRVFRPNKEVYTNRKYHISQKKMGQVDGAWSTRNTVLGWYLDMIAHLPLPSP